ncbi:respiratory nitrate reductase subunit gamma [Streptomyces thermolilacinus]|uniref:NarG-like domain-containing protein n=1 Tax=Streptomyces thermolilacinus SPC6 TaxID=1306406 RepID=A0A1D3DLI7_9ACTN|nr:respiratory nitrate reductase subunit gamma [Streptomyces thermolilacinus]OEJ93184.1 hypothetical protein J116_000455 [Streptomyces thermolilacinus SPC6]
MTASPGPLAVAYDGTGLPLWVALPYFCLAVFAVGHVWHYRRDQFGWTSHTNLHAPTSCPLFAAWPFTAWCTYGAPPSGTCRPYLVYRRKASATAYGTTASPHGHAPARREAGTREAGRR